MTEKTFEYIMDGRKIEVNITEDMRDYLLKKHEADDIERAVLQMCTEMTDYTGSQFSGDITKINFEMIDETTFRTIME